MIFKPFQFHSTDSTWQKERIFFSQKTPLKLHKKHRVEDASHGAVLDMEQLLDVFLRILDKTDKRAVEAYYVITMIDT